MDLETNVKVLAGQKLSSGTNVSMPFISENNTAELTYQVGRRILGQGSLRVV